MDVSHDPRDIAAHFGRLVDDLRRLLAFHGLRSGAPQHLAAFARKLEESKPFRTDFTSLLRSTRDLEHGRLTSDQMLSIVALAVGGESLLSDPSSSPATTHTIALVLMLLAGIGGWSDTGDRAAAEPLHPPALPPAAPSTSALRFTAAMSPTPLSDPADTPAIDVRAFVRTEARSEIRSDARPENRANPRASSSAEPQADIHTQPHLEVPLAPAPPEARPELRAEPPHIVRREPLSEVVRPPALRAEPPNPPAAVPQNPAPTTTEAPRAHAPLRPAAPQPQRWPGPQPKPDPWRPPEPSRRSEAPPPPEVQPLPEPLRRPDLQTVADAPRVPVAPSRFTTERMPAAAASTSAQKPPAAGDLQPQTTATPATAPVQTTAAPAPTQDPNDLDSWTIDQPTPTANHHHPSSRKLTLNAALAIAAVALLALGVFEGLHSRRLAAPAAVATATTPQLASRPPAAEPPSPTSADLTASSDATPPGAASAPSAETTPVPGDTAHPAPHPSLPARAATTEDRTPPAPAASRHAQPQPSIPRSKAASVTPGLEAASLPLPRGPVPVPEATMNRQLVAAHKPVYPPAAVAQRLQGTVVLRAFVSTDGTVRRTDVLAGPPSLINSALAAASWRRYRPFVVNGHPVEVQTEITMHYALPGTNP